MTERRATGLLAGLAAAAALAACTAEPPSRADLAAAAAATLQPAELQQGDVTVRASLAPSRSLNATVAKRDGVQPAPGVQLLLVGVRRGSPQGEEPLAAEVTARARDLRGVWQDVAMREVHSDGFIDYVGTTRVAPPDTLAFEVTVRHAEAQAPAVLRFSRDILP